MKTFRVMYVGLDGEHVPFSDFNRRELADALRCVRALARGDALKADWLLKRERKTIARFPRAERRLR